jgi:hypothetical protein
MFGPPFAPSEARGVLHSDPVEAAALVWRIDGASRDIDAPAGVAFSLQISAHSVEPTIASLSRNLLSHDDRGPVGADEATKVRPQMPWIIGSETFAGDRERLARTGASPEGLVVGPSSHSGCNGPEATSGKEVYLSVVPEFVRLDLLNGSGVDDTWGNDIVGNELPQDRCGLRVNLVVERGQNFWSSSSSWGSNSARSAGDAGS